MIACGPDRSLVAIAISGLRSSLVWRDPVAERAPRQSPYRERRAVQCGCEVHADAMAPGAALGGGTFGRRRRTAPLTLRPCGGSPGGRPPVTRGGRGATTSATTAPSSTRSVTDGCVAGGIPPPGSLCSRIVASQADARESNTHARAPAAWGDQVRQRKRRFPAHGSAGMPGPYSM